MVACLSSMCKMMSPALMLWLLLLLLFAVFEVIRKRKESSLLLALQVPGEDFSGSQMM